MSLEYIKHDRPVTVKQIEEYGRLADHDIRCPLLVIYELGKIKDKNGTLVDVDRNFIEELQNNTNAWIKGRKKNPLSKFFGRWKKSIDKVDAIKLIKDHEQKVDNVIGFSEGLLYTKEIEGTLCLFATAVIADIPSKIRVEGGTLRETSLGTRTDGSLREISFVVNEAAPLCGLMFSEEIDFTAAAPAIEAWKNRSTEEPMLLTKSNKSVELAEQISELELSEAELINTIIPNHNKLSKLIKTGRILPYMYDELITETKTLEFMEKALPSRDLGIMLGSAQLPTLMNTEGFQFQESLKQAKEQFGIKQCTDKDNNTGYPLINKSHNAFMEARQTELKRILELAEIDGGLAINYIKCELSVDTAPQYKDVQLEEYTTQIADIKSKLTHLKQIQLGETHE